MPENLPVERLVREALCAEWTKWAAGYWQLGVPQGAKRLEEPLIIKLICPDNMIFIKISGKFALT